MQRAWLNQGIGSSRISRVTLRIAKLVLWGLLKSNLQPTKLNAKLRQKTDIVIKPLLIDQSHRTGLGAGVDPEGMLSSTFKE